jgi:hypothetical protein
MTALNNFSNLISPAKALGVGVSSLPEISTAAYKLQLDLKKIGEFYTKLDSPIKSKVSKTI